MPPKATGKGRSSPARKASAPKRLGSLSSPTLSFAKVDRSATPARPSRADSVESMPPPPVPPPKPPKTSTRSKGKQRAVPDDVIEIIDSEDDDEEEGERRKRRSGREEAANAMWTELYPPMEQSELAPGKARVEKVRDWLHQAVHGVPEVLTSRGGTPSLAARNTVRKYKRILLVTGPAGIGKTTTVRLVARQLGIELVEWNEGIDERGLGASNSESAVSKLSSFLSRNAYPSLNTTGSSSRSTRPRVLLMTSLPNLSHLPTREAFHAAVHSFCTSFSAASCPLVIVHSDAGAGGRAEESWRDRDRGGLESALDLVGRNVKDAPWCTEIDFLPLAPTFLVKALNRVLNLAIDDPAKQPSPGAVQLVALSCNGDLRSGINSLQLLCTGSSLQDTKKRKTDKDAKRGRATGRGSRGGRGAKVDVSDEIRAALNGVTRQEQSLNLFHALGKVLYNKRLGDPSTEKEDQETVEAISKLPQEDTLPEHLQEYERSKSMVQMETFFPTIPVDASTFALWIHQNVPSFCTEIEELAAILDDFVFADLMRTDDDIWQASPQAIAYALNLTVRGTLMGLPSPVPRHNQKVVKPQFFESYRSERDNTKRVDEAAAHLAKKVVASSVAVADGEAAPEDGVAWGGLPSHTTLASELVPMAIKIQAHSRVPLLPRAVQGLTLPPFGDQLGYQDPLSERDVDGGEDGFGTEVAGEDGMGVPETQGWDVWDDGDAANGDHDELGWLEDDDIEQWSD